jgi:hypothetical protein
MPAEHADESDSPWRRSRRCVGESHCVEVNVVAGGDQVMLRNSTDTGTVLAFDAAEWATFISALKSGEFSLTLPADHP